MTNKIAPKSPNAIGSAKFCISLLLEVPFHASIGPIPVKASKAKPIGVLI